MSLLTSASPFTSNTNGTKDKFVPRMMNTFKQITQSSPESENFYTDEKPSNEETASNKQISSQNEREQRVLRAMNKMTSSSSSSPIDGTHESSDLQLGNYSSDANQKKYNMSISVPPPPSFNTQFEQKSMNTSTTSTVSTLPNKIKENFMSPSGSFSKTSGSSYSESYQNAPYYKQIASSKIPADASLYEHQLMEKLNYMIHLLEEQQKEPTEHIAEEFILYTLLGVFMIYLVDSFTRVGKYTR